MMKMCVVFWKVWVTGLRNINGEELVLDVLNLPYFL